MLPTIPLSTRGHMIICKQEGTGLQQLRGGPRQPQSPQLSQPERELLMLSQARKMSTLKVTGSPSSVPVSHPSISGSGLVPSTGAAPQRSYRNGQRDGGQLDLAQVAAEYGADEVYQENHQLDQDLSAERRGGGTQRSLRGDAIRHWMWYPSLSTGCAAEPTASLLHTAPDQERA